MPSAISPNPRAGATAPGDTANLFNYDDVVEDFLKDIPLGDGTAQNDNAIAREPAKDIDEEITVKKKRKPVPKLDEARLLSDAGLPRLRKITKTHLKFRGKGHEFSDISTLLNTYQLWLDDLFPRAKFRDGLIDIEKVGHSKRMQVMRRAWLDATKPQQRDASPEREDNVLMSGALPDSNIQESPESAVANGDEANHGLSDGPSEDQNNAASNNGSNDAPDDDELDALLAESGKSGPPVTTEPMQSKRGPFEEVESDDDLDALLAAEPSTLPTSAHGRGPQMLSGANKTSALLEHDFADEEEAMASMDMW